MTKDALLQIRLSRKERDHFQAECKRRKMIPSRVVRDLLQAWCAPELPRPCKTETKTETVSPAPRFEWESPEYPWRKPCPACGGHPNWSCVNCGGLGWVMEGWREG